MRSPSCLTIAPLRRTAAVALALLLVVGLAACGDDGGDPDDDPTEQGDGGPSPDDDADDTDDEQDTDDQEVDEVEPLEPADLPAGAVPFADALAATFLTEGAFTSVAPAEADCVASNVVAIVGLERFEQAGITPDEFAAAPDLSSTGIDRGDAEAIYDVFEGCGLDYRASTIDAIVLEAADPSGARGCVEEVLDAATVRELAIAALLDLVDEQPELAEALAAVQTCTAPDEG